MKKNIFSPFPLGRAGDGLFLILIFFISCNSRELQNNYISISGKTQGTTYQIKYSENNSIAYQNEIDSILNEIDLSFSTYNDSSLLVKFNLSDSGCKINEHILKVYWKSCEIHHYSNGAFDPTVKPLINFWGFGSSQINVIDKIDPAKIDSILQFVGFEKIKLYEKNLDTVYSYMSAREFPEGEYYLLKNNKAVQLDFNAIAQGYTVDVLCDFLESKQVENYMVEIGGELRAKGMNLKNQYWKIGIDKPSDESTLDRPIQAIVTLKNQSIATSGNYRKFYVKNGIKYSHTIDPKTGYPVQQNLLSATVVTVDCISADGYATALMAMGLENAKKLLFGNEDLQAYLIYSEENGEWKTFVTDKMKDMIEEK